MSIAITPVLQRLEKEVFLSVLDVTLDIDGKLAVSDEPIVYIQATRTVVRFPVLCPGASVDAYYRYVELREMGLKFLEKHGLINGYEYHKTGFSGFEGRFGVDVDDPQLIIELLTELRAEENRRWPGQKVGTDIRSAAARMHLLADSFHRVALRLRERRAGRDPVVIKDEYDVQYLLGGLLETQFEDVRPEEWGPSHAGAASRVDFFLKNESVLVETKMTRAGLSDKKLGEELIIDTERYKKRTDCKALFCLVYDPEHLLTNPTSLENDLSKITDGLEVRVLIRPKS